MNLTYLQLIENICKAAEKNPEVMQQNVTVYDITQEEFYPVPHTQITKEDDVLDKGHFYLKFN
jgi:hypothetical protein